MKSIQVITDSTYFTVFDKDPEELQNYTRNISNILDSQKVVILHTTEHSVIIRPNKIVSVIVSEVSDDEPVITTPQNHSQTESIDPTENTEQNIETKSTSTVEEDVITDMD